MRHRLNKVFKEGIVRKERRSTQPYSISLKARIIKEYLKGDKSFEMLGKQYEINPGVISRCIRVTKYGHPVKGKQIKIALPIVHFQEYHTSIFPMSNRLYQ
jgi:transposase-like protein